MDSGLLAGQDSRGVKTGSDLPSITAVWAQAGGHRVPETVQQFVLKCVMGANKYPHNCLWAAQSKHFNLQL